MNRGKSKLVLRKLHRIGPKFTYPDDYRVLKYCTLMMTYLDKNSNKFYGLELHEVHLDGNTYFSVYSHYGRLEDLSLSARSTHHVVLFYDSRTEAEKKYKALYSNKTGKQYVEVKLASSKIGSDKLRELIEENQEEVVDESIPEDGMDISEIPGDVEDLVRLIYESASDTLKKKLSAKITRRGIETPLGVLTMSQVVEGEKTLLELKKVFEKNRNNFKKVAASVRRLSGKYYSLIPHKFEGSRKRGISEMVIFSDTSFQDEFELLQLMKDVLCVGTSKFEGDSLVLNQYRALHTGIVSVEGTAMDSIVEFLNSQYDIEIEKVYAVARENEDDRALPETGKNIRLLIHGSRTANWLGLMSRGMLLPQSVVSDFDVTRTDVGMLGFGIYFGDSLYTGLQYCKQEYGEVSLVGIYSVSLGRSKRVVNRQLGITKPPDGYESVLGAASPGSSFKENEYVVYDVSRQSLCFLLQCRDVNKERTSFQTSALVYREGEVGLSRVREVALLGELSDEFGPGGDVIVKNQEYAPPSTIDLPSSIDDLDDFSFHQVPAVQAIDHVGITGEDIQFDIPHGIEIEEMTRIEQMVIDSLSTLSGDSLEDFTFQESGPTGYTIDIPISSKSVDYSPPTPDEIDEMTFNLRRDEYESSLMSALEGVEIGSRTDYLEYYTAEQRLRKKEEDEIRRLFAMERFSEELSDLHLLLIDPYEGDNLDLFRYKRETEEERRQPKLFNSMRTPYVDNALSIVEKDEFFRRWKIHVGGLFDGMDWSNLFVAGGSVVKCLSKGTSSMELTGAGDVDMFVYGLEEEEANERLRDIYSHICSKCPSARIARMKNSVTILLPHEFKHVQVILRLYLSPSEVLTGFDLDSCTGGFDGEHVWVHQRLLRALTRRYNLVDLSRRSLTYETRLHKYAKRGFCVCVPHFRKSKVSEIVYSIPRSYLTGLAKLLALENNRSPGTQHTFREVREFISERRLVPTADNGDDYTNIRIPSGRGWWPDAIVRYVNSVDRRYFFGRWRERGKHRFIHAHAAVTGIEGVFSGMSSWCSVCRSNERSGFVADSGRFNPLHVGGKLHWLTDNPGRQLLTGSFHPLGDEDWEKMAYDAWGSLTGSDVSSEKELSRRSRRDESAVPITDAEFAERQERLEELLYQGDSSLCMLVGVYSEERATQEVSEVLTKMLSIVEQ